MVSSLFSVLTIYFKAFVRLIELYYIIMEEKIMDFFCMKCKKKVVVADSDVTSEVRSNRKLLRAKCPNCGTKMAKFGKMN